MHNTLILTQAITFAAKAHDGQLRKGSDLPYIVHPMEAVAIAAAMTDDVEVLAAAALHDVVEDCGVTVDELRRVFGERIAGLVNFQSEKKEANAQASWQKRKLRTINHLRIAERDNMILTLADKLSNLRSIDRDLRAQGAAFWQRFNQTNPSMHHWYYASIAEMLKPLEDVDPYREYVQLIGKVFGKK